MRKRGKYRPKPVDELAAFRVLAGTRARNSKDLVARDHHVGMMAKLYAAIGNLQAGKGDLRDFTVVAHSANISAALCRVGIGAEHEPELLQRMRLVQQIDERAEKLRRWVCTGEQLQAIRWIADLHEAQTEDDRATVGVLVQVEDQVLKALHEKRKELQCQ
jgi:hypothetical protein